MLIPPRISVLYTKLLKAEDHELKRNTPDSDKELQYIRYLKDALVKKCTKLVYKQLKSEPNLQLGDRKTLSFTVPSHFSLKRLEQWYEQRRVIRDAPLESTREGNVSPPYLRFCHLITLLLGHSQRKRADFYVENSDGSTFRRERELAAAQASGRRVAQEPLPDDGVSPVGQESVRSPRLNLQNIASNIKQSLKFGHASLSPTGKLMPNNKSNGRPQYYTNNDVQGTNHNPYFDPNYTLDARSPGNGHGSVPSSPMYPPTSSPMHSPQYDPSLIPGQTRSDPTDRVSHSPTSAVDPSRLKSRFDAAYPDSQIPLGDHNGRPSLPRRTSASSGTRISPPGATTSQLHGGTNTARSPIRKSFTIGHPIHGSMHGNGMSPPTADQDHRRRATLDSGDTDRSVPRRKGYMYRTTEALVADSARIYGQQPLQGGTYLEPSRNGSRPRQNGDATTQGFSPMAAAQAQLSPLGRASTVSSVSYTGSPKQRSPMSDRLSVPSSSPQIPQGGSNLKPLQQRRASPIPPSSSPNTQSPHLRTRGSSADSSSGPPVIPRELYAPSTERRSSSDRDRKNPNKPGSHGTGSAMPTLYEQNTRQGESAVRTEKPAQADDGSMAGTGHTARTNKNGHSVQSPAQRNEPLQYETPVNIWKTNGPIKPVSTRSSIYTSGESDGGPVIPDASLIMDAVSMRAREKPHRRQLVPFLSSSEENTSYRPTDVDTDFSSDDSDSDDGRGRQNNGTASYGRIHKDRDGYASGYTSEAGSVAGSVRSRASSRAPSRPPSRGILKRSNSACSQRSGKSVRLEITEDRVALEEAREAEEAVNRASKHRSTKHMLVTC